MHTDFWLERWEKNQIAFHQDEFNNQLQTFWRALKIPEGRQIFVPLCGKSLDMLWLRAQGLQVFGIELSAIAVRDFFTENSLDATVTTQGKFQRWETDGLVILQGDFFDLTATDIAACAGVFDRASLIALPPVMRQRYAQHFASIVPTASQTLLITMEYDQAEMKGPPFAVHEEEVRALYTAFTVKLLFDAEVLAANPQFRQRGLRAMREKVYVLQGNKA